MRRCTSAVAAVAAALTTLIPGAAHAGTDERDVPSDAPPTDVPEQHDVEELRLECAVRAADAGPVVGCTWSAPSSPRAAGVRLFRFDPATDPHRQVIFRAGDVGVTHHVDAEVRPGHRYAYAVQAVTADGAVVGQSATVWVEVPEEHDVEALRLACTLGRAGEAIGCEWSRPASRDAYVVTLWRSVNDGPREVVERFRPGGPTAYRDPVPAGATEVTYAVIATSESDRIVARSRAASVRIPSDRPIDVRPVDRVASDAGPAVAPADAAPGAGVPGDVAPPSTPPASVDATTDVSAQAPAAFVRLVTLRARLLRLVRELAAF